MEKLQGIQYRREDVPAMQFWPIQHEFFPSQKAQITSELEEPTLRSNFTDVNKGKIDDFGRMNWKDSWEWDSFVMSARPSSMNTNASPQVHHGPSIPTSSSSFHKREANESVSNEPTLLELGLNSSLSSTRRKTDDDNLLALKLGGNGHMWRSEEIPQQNVKRSRHSPPETQPPRCQVDNCTMDLKNAKDYHRRHKVCELHAKASKAPVSGMLQRFCQQCSRFHVLHEFDDDRRSCRRRLAGHNRRRRKNQPDANAALASILADQNALSKIMNPLGPLQAKDELDKLRKLLGGGETLLETLMSSAATIGETCNKSSALGAATTNNLVNTIAKSQVLGNLLLSNPNLTCNLSATTASTEASIAALSNAVLLSLMQSQQKIDANGSSGDHIPINERNSEFCTNTFSPGNVTQQDTFAVPNFRAQPISAAFPNSGLMGKPITPPICSDNSNESNGDSADERIHGGYTQEGGYQERYARNRMEGQIQDCDHEKDFPKARVQNLGCTESHSPDEHFDTVVVGSDHSSDTSLDKQEQTFQLWFKIFDRGPGDLPSSLRKQMLEWLDHLPTEMEGYIRPGCIILSIFICMPVHAWQKLCRNIEEKLHKLVWSSEGEFLRKGQVLVQLGSASALIVDGKVMRNTIPRVMQRPNLILVRPFAVTIGEKVDLTLKGYDLKRLGTKVICSYEGKCIEREVAFTTSLQLRKRERGEEQDLTPLETEDQDISFHVGPFNNQGHAFIEVEGQLVKGNSFPIIVADKTVCDDVGILEEEFTRNLGNGVMVGPNKATADITHFLYEFGWLLHRNKWKLQYMDSGLHNFSSERYQWLLRFSVERGYCAIVKNILDILFCTNHESKEHVNATAHKILSETNLLHIAVKNNSRNMVECLLGYNSTTSVSDVQQRYVFRPDTPSHGGLTPLHVAASMHSDDEVLDALTNTPEELWAKAWTSAKDCGGQTPLMYALAAGRKNSIKLIQQKLGSRECKRKEETERAPQHVALNVDGDNNINSSSPRSTLFSKKIHAYTCRGRDLLLTQNLPLRIRGLNTGSLYRPFMLSMLTVAAVCVCVGVLMKGPPSVNFVQGPFVWESIRYGPK